MVGAARRGLAARSSVPRVGYVLLRMAGGSGRLHDTGTFAIVETMMMNARPPAPFRHLLVCASPSVDSFDHAIVDAYADTVRGQGHDIVIRDLYAMAFDPVLRAAERPAEGDWLPAPDVAIELDLLHAADLLILVYPIWYGLPPAMLKGYVDRVLGANHSFRKIAANTGQPALVGKPLLSFSTSGLPAAWLHDHGQDGALRAILDVYLWRAFGMRQSEHVALDEIMPNMSTQHAASQLDRVRTIAARTCNMLAGIQPARWEA